MSNAERRLLITRLLAFLLADIALYFASSLVKAKRAMEASDVVRDAELFLKASRLQDLNLPEHLEIIKALERAWSNANYRGKWKAITVAEWVRQTNTLSP